MVFGVYRMQENDDSTATSRMSCTACITVTAATYRFAPVLTAAVVSMMQTVILTLPLLGLLLPCPVVSHWFGVLSGFGAAEVFNKSFKLMYCHYTAAAS